MRVLFTCLPGRAHANALAPLVLATRDAGHEVAVATARTFGSGPAFEGIPVLPSGVDWSQGDPASLPEFHGGGGPPIAAFAAVAGRGMVEDLVAHAETFRPDLLVWDAMEFGGRVAAELLGLPHASFASAMGTPRALLDQLTGGKLAELPARYGLDPDPGLRRMAAALVLHRRPRVLDLPWAEPYAQEFRYRPAMFDEPPLPLPAGIAAPAGRPLVHLSLGTAFAGTAAATAVQRAVIAACAGEPLQLLVSTGGADPAGLGPLPANTQAVRYVEHRALLPHCAAFLGHGSYSSILVAVAHGVPLAFLPLDADQPVVSMHLANLGLGVNLATTAGRGPVPVLDPAALSADSVRAAVGALLSGSRYRDTVAAVGAEFRRLPPVTAAPDRLARLVAEWPRPAAAGARISRDQLPAPNRTSDRQR